MHRMLRLLSKGKVPTPSCLAMGKEEFVSLVTRAVSGGYVEGVYISFCDSADADSLLSSAKLTPKGLKEAGKKRFPFFRRSD